MPDFSKFWKIIIFVVVFIIALYVSEYFNHKEHVGDTIEEKEDW